MSLSLAGFFAGSRPFGAGWAKSRTPLRGRGTPLLATSPACRRGRAGARGDVGAGSIAGVRSRRRSPRRRLSGSGCPARPPDEPERAEDRDLQDDEEKEDRPEPLHAGSVPVGDGQESGPLDPAAQASRAATWASSSPRCGLGRDQQGRLLALLRPLVTALVEVVVDPGDRPPARVLVERPQLPVRRRRRATAPSKLMCGSSGSPSSAGR